MIATEWKEFLEIDWQHVYDNMSKPAFVFDGRLLIDAEKLRKIGFTVSCGVTCRRWSVRFTDIMNVQVKTIGRADLA